MLPLPLPAASTQGHVQQELCLPPSEDMPEIYGPLKTNKQEQRRLFGVALQSKLACARAEAQLARARAEADAEAKLAQLARAKAEADAEAKLARELAHVKAEADAEAKIARDKAEADAKKLVSWTRCQTLPLPLPFEDTST